MVDHVGRVSTYKLIGLQHVKHQVLHQPTVTQFIMPVSGQWLLSAKSGNEVPSHFQAHVSPCRARV